MAVTHTPKRIGASFKTVDSIIISMRRTMLTHWKTHTDTLIFYMYTKDYYLFSVYIIVHVM